MVLHFGRELKVEIRSDYAIIVDGRSVNVFRAIKRARHVPKVLVKRASGHLFLVDQETIRAINAYVAGSGYAGLKLHEYLDRIFGG